MCIAQVIFKYSLFFVNLVFFLAGLGLVGVGIAVLLQISEIVNLIPANLNGIPIAVIVVGFVIFLIAFCGCWGAIRESRCLLFLYSLCMLLIAAGKIYLAVVIFNNLNDLSDLVEKWVNDLFNVNNLGGFHVLETAFKCCGTTGPEAYTSQSISVPLSCCDEPWHADLIGPFCNINEVYREGCIEQLGSYFETYGEVVGYILIAIISCEIIASIFALCLSQLVKKRSPTVKLAL